VLEDTFPRAQQEKRFFTAYSDAERDKSIMVSGKPESHGSNVGEISPPSSEFIGQEMRVRKWNTGARNEPAESLTFYMGQEENTHERQDYTWRNRVPV